MMKKGFTLLELIIVIIIIGILATLGFAQYSRMIERSRGAEARMVLGAIRTQAIGQYMQRGGIAGSLPANTLTEAMVGVGDVAGQIAKTCAAAAPSTSYYFGYAVTQVAVDTMVATATRCVGAVGKQPGGPAATTLVLTSNFATGSDVWTGTGGY